MHLILLPLGIDRYLLIGNECRSVGKTEEKDIPGIHRYGMLHRTVFLFVQ